MRVEILGSGGAGTIPRPGCQCRVCAQARERGTPHARGGPSVFVHGPDILFDTPEESKQQIDRSTVGEIAACFYSHWHPDHTGGWRMWETRNSSFPSWPPRNRSTDIYLPQQVGADFRTWLGLWESFRYMQEQHGFVRVVELRDGESVGVNGVNVLPFRVAVDYVYAFLLDDGRRRILIAPDELYGWAPPGDLGRLDLAVLAMGLAEMNPLTGERRIPAEHPILKMEATLEQTLAMVRALRAERVILTHVEEADGLTYDDLLEVQARLQADGLPVEFAWDGMTIDIP